MWPDDPITIFAGSLPGEPIESREDNGEAGFGLLDTVIALAAVSTLLALLPHAVLGSGELIAKAEAGVGAAQAMRMVAASELAAGQGPAVRVGQMGGRSWRAVTRTAEVGRRDEDAGHMLALETTALTIALDADRTVTIEALTVGREP